MPPFLEGRHAMADLLLNNPRHWRHRAEEACTRAEQVNEPEARAAMLDIANSYDRIAERAETRLRDAKDQK
jgi:hypothetical protein